MSNQTNVFLSFEVEQTLHSLGLLLRQARLARGDTEEQVASRLNVSRATWRRIEKGDANVRSGTLLQAMVLFQLKERVLALAEEDALTNALVRRHLPMRGSSPRRTNKERGHAPA